MNDSYRLYKIAKKIVSDWISFEKSPNEPTENGPWHKTPKGWSNVKKTKKTSTGKYDFFGWVEAISKPPKVVSHPFTDNDWSFENDINEVYVLSHGTKKTIFKPTTIRDYGIRKSVDTKKISSSRREVIAFEISEKLGLDVIPPTFLTTTKVPVPQVGDEEFVLTEKIREGSEQAFVKGKTWQELSLEKGKDGMRKILKNDTVKKQLGMISVVDYLIGSTDRHSKNLMIDDELNIHAIDNGLSLALNDVVGDNGQGEFRSLPTDILFRMYQDYDEDYSIGNMLFEDYNATEFQSDFDQFTRLQIIKDANGFHPQVEKFFNEFDYDGATEKIIEIMKHYKVDSKTTKNIISRLNDIKSIFKEW